LPFPASRTPATIFARSPSKRAGLLGALAATPGGITLCERLARSSLYDLRPAATQRCGKVQTGRGTKDSAGTHKQVGALQMARGRTSRKKAGSAKTHREEKDQRPIKPLSKGATGPTEVRDGANGQVSLHRRASQYQFHNGRINSPIGSHRTGAGVPPSGADRSHRCFAGTA
jgi:hypothetical protein